MKHSILVVDDERDILDSIERQFRKLYRVLKASSGIEALRLLQTEKVHLIISDQRMPEMTGVQLFERVQKIQPDAIRILLTGYTDIESVIAAVNNGHIYRYVTKPWDPTDLDINVRRALDAYDLKAELKEKNLKLEEALRELQTLDKAKSHFMLLIGHELKTPLTTISSFLDLLKEEKISSDMAKYIQRIEQGSLRLKDIVFDVLDILSAETNQMRLKKEALKLSPVVDHVVKEMKPLAEKKSVVIQTEEVSGAGTGKVNFDSTVIAKVVRKILHNAIKFSPEQGEIQIQLKSGEKDISLLISNQGPTLDKSKIAQILKPFALDEDIMHHSQGMGLGLSVSQSLLKSHGTELLIESNAKKTTVGFKLLS